MDNWKWLTDRGSTAGDAFYLSCPHKREDIKGMKVLFTHPFNRVKFRFLVRWELERYGDLEHIYEHPSERIDLQDYVFSCKKCTKKYKSVFRDLAPWK